MDRKTFESLTLEEQLKYVNDRREMTTREIGETIGMPPSSLSNLFSNVGYKRVKGIYIKKEQTPQNSSVETPIYLQELLQYKEEIIAMVQGKRPYSTQIDFSFLKQFDKEIGKKTLTFDLPEELAERLEAFVTGSGYKKQAVLSLAIYNFLQNYGEYQ